MHLERGISFYFWPAEIAKGFYQVTEKLTFFSVYEKPIWVITMIELYYIRTKLFFNIFATNKKKKGEKCQIYYEMFTWKQTRIIFHSSSRLYDYAHLLVDLANDSTRLEVWFEFSLSSGGGGGPLPAPQ